MKLLALIAAAVLAAATPAFAQTASLPNPYALKKVVLPTDVRPDRYDIRVAPNAEKLTLSGSVSIGLTVLRATDRIVLNAADLEIQKASLSGQPAPRMVRNDEEQTVAFVFPGRLAPGRYTLSVEYTGKIYQQASGLFALDYDDPNAAGGGGKKRALFTQFENSDARRFAPMYDEPGVKSVFALTIEAPKGQMAVSNMPVVETRDLPGGRMAVRFADSPKMSSYLLFMALGDFERISQKVGPTDVGVVVRRGDTEKGRYALDAAVKTLEYFNDWFDTPYPLPKLDLVAGPGRSQFFAAMENWGAIFYFDYAILIDPKLSTESDRQQVFVTVAHEVAHQWFGNLVTMSWWDDLWLNEGFASWMENKATDHFHPEWNMWLTTQAGQQGAMRLDARSGTHPVVTHIPDVFAASAAFDTISYQKGQAVIRMLEAYVGEDPFRAGLRDYIKRHAYGNTTSNDLWAALDRHSPRKVSELARDFTLQEGVPMIRVKPAGTTVALSQERFGAEPSQRTPKTWRVPVTVKGLNGGEWRGIVSGPAARTVPVGAPAVVNAGQTGYFRTVYAPELWAKLAPRFPALTPADQLGLLYDSRALGEIGVAPMSDFLALAKAAPANADPIVLQTLSDQLAAIDWVFDGRPSQAAYRAFVIGRLNPIARRLGWDPKSGEADNDALLRRSVLTTLGSLGEPAVVAEARRRFERYQREPDSLVGAGRRTVLAIVAANADARTWDALHAMAKASKDITDRNRLYGYLGASNDPALADRALRLALTDELTPSEAPSLIAAVSGVYPDKAYDFAVANRTKVDTLLEPTSRTSYYAELATTSRDRAMVGKLEALAATVPASSRGEIDKALSSIRFRLGVIAERVPEVERWLAANG